jgi:glucose-6-phosphate isomerase, archaeal
MSFDPKLEIRLKPASLSFEYGPCVFGPQPEYRRIAEIRSSLLDPYCEGPDPVYAIAMDVSRIVHRDELFRRKLLFGVVAFASGKLGKELVRSQGHVHAISPHCGCSTPELIEIWQGRAIVYIQEATDDDPGRCFAVEAQPGEKVVIPPEWAHCVINADPAEAMVFGAWCVREYGFEYSAVRARGGLAWFPVWEEEAQQLKWERNPAYNASYVVKKQSRDCPELSVWRETPIYEQFSMNPDSLQWISNPSRAASIWEKFEP